MNMRHCCRLRATRAVWSSEGFPFDVRISSRGQCAETTVQDSMNALTWQRPYSEVAHNGDNIRHCEGGNEPFLERTR